AFVLSFFQQISRPGESLFILIFILFSNIGGGWFTSFTLIDQSFRLLFFDVLLATLLGLLLIRISNKKTVRPFYLALLFMSLQLYWIKGFLIGSMEAGFGGAFGEARFYLSSLLFFSVLYFFKDRKDLILFIRIISLCSLYICIAIFSFIVLEQGNYSAERYNPGNPIMTVMVWGLMIATFDFQHKTQLSAIPIRPEFLIAIYLAFIFLSGCRTMSIVALIFTVYSFILSPKIKFKAKLGIFLIFVLAGAVFSQTPPGQKIIEEQSSYLEKSQDSSKTYGAKTTFEWRLMMWQAFWDHIADDPQRILWGRGFMTEQVNIESVHWKWGNETVRYVDSSMAHNDFMVILLSNGLIFTLVFVFLILAYLWKGFRTKSSKKSKELPLGELFSFFLIVLIFQSSFNASFKHYGFSMMIWLVLGCMAHLFSLRKNHLPIPKQYSFFQHKHKQ
ncbi:MAG: O-antigen ligase family protein, partial [Bacteroidota bacterium]